MLHAANDAEVIRGRIREMVATDSINGVARRLGLSRHAILTLATPGAQPRPGTIALARERIAAAVAAA